MGWFVALSPQFFRGRSVCELGAGCGLSGLVAAHTASSVVLTDGNEVVLRLLQRNAQQHACPDKVSVAKLIWGDQTALQIYLSEHGAPDVLLGADVVCWPQFVTPFLLTVKGLLQASVCIDAALYLGYVCRATTTTTALHAKAAAMGLAVEALRMPPNHFNADPEAR